jgi:ABC-type nitrate/sulfonate/bicarbonate transport system ATPase subunit
MSEIVLEGVSKHYGAVRAVDDVTFRAEAGKFLVLLGPSGCGKSTLLRLIAGLERPTAGVITQGGRPITGPSAARGMVFQSYTLFPWLTVRRNVEFGLDLRGVPAAERRRIALGFIRQVGLEGFEDAYPDQLSGGMRQRAALARALANDPEILLMDEPFGALDSQTRALMQEMLLGIWEQSHKTVLFVTHDIDEALFLGDVVYVMSARPGRIKEEIAVDIPRPRALDVLTAPAFIVLKRRVLGLIREEAMRALAEA